MRSSKYLLGKMLSLVNSSQELMVSWTWSMRERRTWIRVMRERSISRYVTSEAA